VISGSCSGEHEAPQINPWFHIGSSLVSHSELALRMPRIVLRVSNLLSGWSGFRFSSSRGTTRLVATRGFGGSTMVLKAAGFTISLQSLLFTLHSLLLRGCLPLISIAPI
jgi:hypothetical protein